MKPRKVKGLDPEGPLADNARRIVEVRLAELRSFAPKALDSGGQETLHDMRIAAKRLRYVLEMSEPAFGRAATDAAKVAKQLQDLLGEIHDCDEMLPRVRAHAEALRAQDAEALCDGAGGARDLEPGAAREAPNRARYRGLESLGTYLTARRAVLFERFVRRWEKLESSGFARKLLDGLNRPEPAPAARPDGAAA
ncbi:MAG TPA: CHAD domain-containing protein [Thermoleophilaceae bacterium]|nr:CHAD domain-containing protein [Thermoleophilaceae bacterium]